MEEELKRMLQWASENSEDWKIVMGAVNVGIERNKKIHQALVKAELNVLSNMLGMRIYHMCLEDIRDEVNII